MHCLVKNITLLHRAHNIHTKYIMTKVSAVESFFLNIKISFGKVGIGMELLRNNKRAEKDLSLLTMAYSNPGQVIQ